MNYETGDWKDSGYIHYSILAFVCWRMNNTIGRWLHITNRMCGRCGASYTDQRVFVVDPGPGLCHKCKGEIPYKIIAKMLSNRRWLIFIYYHQYYGKILGSLLVAGRWYKILNLTMVFGEEIPIWVVCKQNEKGDNKRLLEK